VDINTAAAVSTCDTGDKMHKLINSFSISNLALLFHSVAM
jgi:hypothetical protein